MGAFSRPPGRDVEEDIERTYEKFPRLAARRHNSGAVLSGGEQQMLAIARALMGNPRLIMLDEPSLGLSPRVSNEVFAQLDVLRRERNLAIVVVEQSPQTVLELADRVYIFELGKVVSEGRPEELSAQDVLLDSVLGPRNGKHAVKLSTSAP